MEKYHTAIIGATFYGGAAALANPEKSIVIERTNLIGKEFVDSFNEKPGKKIYINSKLGHEFHKMLSENNNIDDEGYLYGFAAVAELCRMFLKAGIRISFLTEIYDIKKAEGGFLITLFNQEGEKTIFAENILDTTAEGALKDPCFKLHSKKYINAVAEGEGLIINNLTSKSFLRFPVDIDEDIISARHRLYTYLKETGLKSYLVSNDFAYEMPFGRIEMENGYVLAPSCGYYNLLEAFDEGSLFYEQQI